MPGRVCTIREEHWHRYREVSGRLEIPRQKAFLIVSYFSGEADMASKQGELDMTLHCLQTAGAAVLFNQIVRACHPCFSSFTTGYN